MMLRETGQSRRDKRDPSPLTGGPGGVSFIETDSRTVGARGWRGRERVFNGDRASLWRCRGGCATL